MNDNSVIKRAEENNTCSDSITLDDLSEDARCKIERELKEERQESLQRKLAGHQKTRDIVVTKVPASDHSASPSTEVSKSLSSTKFKEVRIANTLPISQFNQVFILDKSSDYPRSSRLYVLGNNILVNSTLSVPKLIYAFSQLRDMFYDNFATRNMKLIADKIKESDFNRIKYSSELSNNASSSEVQIAELESNSDSVKTSDKNLKISKDKKTDVSNVKECNSEASDSVQSAIVKG